MTLFYFIFIHSLHILKIKIKVLLTSKEAFKGQFNSIQLQHVLVWNNNSQTFVATHDYLTGYCNVITPYFLERFIWIWIQNFVTIPKAGAQMKNVGRDRKTTFLCKTAYFCRLWAMTISKVIKHLRMCFSRFNVFHVTESKLIWK